MYSGDTTLKINVPKTSIDLEGVENSLNKLKILAKEKIIDKNARLNFLVIIEISIYTVSLIDKNSQSCLKSAHSFVFQLNHLRKHLQIIDDKNSISKVTEFNIKQQIITSFEAFKFHNANISDPGLFTAIEEGIDALFKPPEYTNKRS